MTSIAIIGCGLIGRAWAISFARAGNQVRLWDTLPNVAAEAQAFVASVLGDLSEQGLLHAQAPQDVLARISCHTDLAAALDGALYVQESTPENREIKREVFSMLDRLAHPDAVIASSTSALLPSSFTGHLDGRHRCLVVHPINPPYLIPAVEIVPAEWTSAQAVESARAIMVAAGQAPLVMRRECDGFIMNRLQGALLEEAFRLVDSGFASVEDVDIGIRDGLALRWSFMGPFETIDLNAPAGVRDYVNRYQSIYANIFPQMQHRVDWAGPVMETIETDRRARLPQDKLRDRQIWRDRRLMALRAHKEASNKEFGA